MFQTRGGSLQKHLRRSFDLFGLCFFFSFTRGVGDAEEAWVEEEWVKGWVTEVAFGAAEGFFLVGAEAVGADARLEVPGAERDVGEGGTDKENDFLSVAIAGGRTEVLVKAVRSLAARSWRVLRKKLRQCPQESG